MQNFSKIYDISLPLSNDTIVYPGDPRVVLEARKHHKALPRLTHIALGSHSGTHVDAPSHYTPSGAPIDAVSLDHFMGPCRVLDMTRLAESVTRKDLEKYDIKAGERILLKTQNTQRGYTTFRTDYIFLAADAASYLAAIGVALVGIDYLSIKQKGSDDNTAHLAFLERGIPILESIVLTNVPAGEYFLCAAPLAFVGIDGSPVRALLLS